MFLTANSTRKLLTWFDLHRRQLPWRAGRDPYHIWLSEVMLQQTTVSAVLPRFKRFLTRFPSIQSFARADEQEVLKEWEGLGYYHRARNFHREAREVVALHDGEIPNDPDWFGRLPGVGRYILGAVLSQAFDRPLPIVEANSARVLCRLFGQNGDPASAAVRNWLWDTAQAIVPKRRAGDYNQALMEFGDLVCMPRSPSCNRCPLRRECRARRIGEQDSIPRRACAGEDHRDP